MYLRRVLDAVREGARSALCLVVLCSTVVAQETTRKRVVVPTVDNPPVIDGSLDDAIWQQAAVVDDLEVYLPVPYARSTETSRFLLLHDDDALYIGADMRDSEPDRIVQRQLIQRQTVFRDDNVEIALDPYDSRRGGYVFSTNPNGVQRDGLVFTAGRFNMNWDGIWESRARVTETGWTAEVVIPFKTISFDPQRDEWGLNFTRMVRRKGEGLTWSMRDGQPTIDTMGVMAGMRGVKPGRGLDVVPSAILNERKDFVLGQSDSELKPSLDVFYRFTPSLTGALTFNTDFSATEVDGRQVNLTRFSLFFPEKRDFFLEDAGIFEFAELTRNGRPFFSRTIGLSSEGAPVDLVAGAKLTGTAGPWTMGFVGVRQDDFGNLAASDLAVGRVYRRVLDQSTLGGIFTYGDPASNQSNKLVGFDFNFRNTNWIPERAIESEVWFQQSDSEGISGNDSAFGASIRYPNDQLDLRLNFAEIQENFNPAMGFVNRSGIRSYSGRARYRWRFPERWVSTYRLSLIAEEISARDGGLQSRSTALELLEFQSRPGDFFKGYLRREEEVLVNPFNLLGRLTIPVGRYRFDRYGARLTTAGFRAIDGTIGFERGEFFDGDRRDWNTSISINPNRHLLAELSYQINAIDLPTGSFTARIMGLKLNAAFNVRWAWLNFLQWDNVSNRLGLNSRLRYIPKLGQEFFLVLNYDFLDTTASRDFESALRDTTLKLSYTFRY